MKSKRFFAALGAAVITLSAVTTANAQSCPKIAPVSNGSTSGNSRAPTPNFQFERGVYLITAAELTAAGFASGTAPTSIGWRYTTASATATPSAPLIVYMENTADTTNLKSATWATAISTMTVVHNNPVVLPQAVGPFDFTLTGGSPFTYTGGGLYIAFDYQQAAPPTSTTTVLACLNANPTCLTGQSNTAPPITLGAPSVFRAETRLGGVVALPNDAAVAAVYSVGQLTPCSSGPQIISAVISNPGFNPQTNLQVTLNVTGANTFTDTQTIPTVNGCGGTATVTFASFTPSNIGSNTIAVSVPADDAAPNNSVSRAMNTTTTDSSYKYPGAAITNGVGLTTVGAFVAKFSSTVADTITDVTLEFFAVTATTYRVAIYADIGGVPSTTPLYVDAADRTVTTAGPVTITLPSPVPYVAGNVWVGIQQTNTTNANLSFDVETPIRPTTFFFATALPVATWIDFAPNNSFKLNVGIKTTACAAPLCPGNANADTNVDVLDLLIVINAWGACPPPCPPCQADIAQPTDCQVTVLDLLTVINGWGPCP